MAILYPYYTNPYYTNIIPILYPYYTNMISIVCPLRKPEDLAISAERLSALRQLLLQDPGLQQSAAGVLLKFTGQ